MTYKYNINLTDRELQSLIFIVNHWHGMPPHDGTEPTIDNPRQEETKLLFDRLIAMKSSVNPTYIVAYERLGP